MWLVLLSNMRRLSYRPAVGRSKLPCLFNPKGDGGLAITPSTPPQLLRFRCPLACKHTPDDPISQAECDLQNGVEQTATLAKKRHVAKGASFDR